MKLTITVFSILLFVVFAVAQDGSKAELKLRILVDKDAFALNEAVVVKAEFTNTSRDTLCFPEPDQSCEIPVIGSVITTGEPVTAGDERDHFICHTDGRGKTGNSLDSAIMNHWIKLPPNGVYVTKAARAYTTLDKFGQWRLSATYRPPEGSFSSEYRKLLQSAAKRAGCVLPMSVVAAEPKIISVSEHR